MKNFFLLLAFWITCFSAISEIKTVNSGDDLNAIINCSYNGFVGLTFTNAMWGIYIKGSTHIIIRNNEILNTGREGFHIGRSSRQIDNSSK